VSIVLLEDGWEEDSEAESLINKKTFEVDWGMKEESVADKYNSESIAA
jgi:hypothetical protein